MTPDKLKAPEGQSDNVDITTEFLGQFGDNQDLVKKCIGTGDDNKRKFENILKSDSDGKLADGIKQILGNEDLDESQKESEIIGTILETGFLQKFKGQEQKLVADCIKETKDDPQLRNGFMDLLKSDNFEALETAIKQELKVGIEGNLDEDTLKLLISSIIAEKIEEGFKIGSIDLAANQATEADVMAAKDEAAAAKDEAVAAKDEAVAAKDEATATERTGLVTEAVAAAAGDEATALENMSDYEKAEKMLQEAKQGMKEILKDHPDVEETVKEKAEIAKQQLPEETKNQLKEKGYSEEFINDYILVRVTLNEVKGNPDFNPEQVAQFENKVNELSRFDIFFKSIDNSCNIADTNRSSFDTKNISQTRTELFNKSVGNESLIKAKDWNKGEHYAIYAEMFNDENIMTTIERYEKFFPEDTKHYLEEYKQHIKDNTLDEYEQTEEGQKVKETLLTIKEKVDGYTQDFIEEMCLMSHVKGMTMCMGEDFNLNKANEIKNENGVFTLNGHVDGVDFSLRHDAKNPDARLQTSSKFSVNADKNSFTIGAEGKFTDSNFKLPSQGEVFELVTQRVKVAMDKGGVLDNAGSKEEFLKAMSNDLQNDIMGRMDVAYKDTEMTHHYITNKVRSEKIVDNASGLIKSINPTETTLPGEISESSNPKLFNFTKILNFNLENSTPEEKDKLDRSITQIKRIIAETKNRNGSGAAAENGADNGAGNGTVTDRISDIQVAKGSIAENYLKSNEWNNEGTEASRNSQRNLISELFSKYSEHSQDTRFSQEGSDGEASKMIINDLYRDLFETGSGPSEASRRWADKQVQENASDVLDLDNPDVWPPTNVNTSDNYYSDVKAAKDNGSKGATDANEPDTGAGGEGAQSDVPDGSQSDKAVDDVAQNTPQQPTEGNSDNPARAGVDEAPVEKVVDGNTDTNGTHIDETGVAKPSVVDETVVGNQTVEQVANPDLESKKADEAKPVVDETVVGNQTVEQVANPDLESKKADEVKPVIDETAVGNQAVEQVVDGNTDTNGTHTDDRDKDAQTVIEDTQLQASVNVNKPVEQLDDGNGRNTVNVESANQVIENNPNNPVAQVENANLTGVTGGGNVERTVVEKPPVESADNQAVEQTDVQKETPGTNGGNPEN